MQWSKEKGKKTIKTPHRKPKLEEAESRKNLE
jgi:hypothetical protein